MKRENRQKQKDQSTYLHRQIDERNTKLLQDAQLFRQMMQKGVHVWSWRAMRVHSLYKSTLSKFVNLGPLPQFNELLGQLFHLK